MIRMLFYGALLVLMVGTFGLVGCGEEQPAPDETAAPAEPATPSKDPATTPGMPLTQIVEAALQGQSARVLAQLAAPIYQHDKPVRNRHLAIQTDTVRTLGYDGLTLEIYDVAGPEGRFIDHLIVTGKQYETAEGLRVGSSRATVEAVLGAPTERHGDTYIYDRGDPTPNPLSIAFSGDTVSRLEWDFYVD